MKAPTACRNQALKATQSHADFARLSGERRLLVIQVGMALGRELLLSGKGADDQAGRVVAALTNSSRLGDATARAVRAWAQDM